MINRRGIFFLLKNKFCKQNSLNQNTIKFIYFALGIDV